MLIHLTYSLFLKYLFSRKESANLNAIIRVIRRAMHPYLSGIRDQGGFILEYPEVLTPVLLMPDNDQNIFYKLFSLHQSIHSLKKLLHKFFFLKL